MGWFFYPQDLHKVGGANFVDMLPDAIFYSFW